MTDEIHQNRAARDRALFDAALQGDAARVEKLLQAGADASVRLPRNNDYGPMISALYGAVGGGHLAAAALLIRHGAKVDAGSPEGRTPLMAAVAQGDVALARLLIEAGAKRHLRYGPDGILDMAEDCPHPRAMVRLLLEKLDAAALQETLLDAARAAKPVTVEIALSLGADIRACDHTGNTALILAAQNTAKPDAAAKVLRLLLDKGAHIDAENDLQETALCAAMMRHPVPAENVRLLVEAGADITRTTLAGITVFEAAQLAGNEKILPWFEAARKQSILREMKKYHEGAGTRITVRKPLQPKPPQ